MKRHVLKFDHSFYDFILIAIDTSAEDCQLAFLLNKYLSLRLVKNEEGLSFSEEKSKGIYSLYTFEEDYNEWYLIANTCQINEAIGMFPNSSSRRYLIPEQKKIKFFLKIEGEIDEQEIIELINKIPKVLYSYVLDPQVLKSKEFLIF